MNEKSLLMKNEIRIISIYRGLMLSKYYFFGILSMITIYLFILRLAPSSLYILITLAALPPILQSSLTDYTKTHKNRFFHKITEDYPFQLSRLKMKYKYTRLNYITNLTAYSIMILLICLWQIKYSTLSDLNLFLNKLPLVTLITGLTLQLFAVLIYRVKLPYDIMHNKV
jgi:hypothetical protein